MPAVVAWIFSGIMWAVRALLPTATLSLGNIVKVYFWAKVAKIITSIGVGVTVYQISGFGVDQLYSALQGIENSVPANIVQILALSGVFEGFSIMLSGISMALAIKGFKTASNSFKTIGF